MGMDIVKEFLSPRKEDEFPHFYARFNMGGRTYSYNLRHKRMFEGMKKTITNGKVDFVVDPNFSLVVDGETGYCKIADTPYNRKKFDLLSTPRKRTVIKHELKYDKKTGEEVPVQTETVIEEPPMFERLDRGSLEKQAVTMSLDQLQAIADKQGIEIVIRPKNHGAEPEVKASKAEREPVKSKSHEVPRRSKGVSEDDDKLLMDKLDEMEEQDVNITA